MRKAGPAKPHNRAGIWYLIRRVPKEFAHLDRREPVRLSTDIAVADDPRAVHAKKVVERLNIELEGYWRGLRDGQSVEARIRFDAARKRATALGLQYQTAGEIRDAGRMDDLLDRVELLMSRQALEDEVDVAAALGGELRPRLLYSKLVDEYAEMKKGELVLKSANQRRKWRNPRLLAIDNFINLIGDKPIEETTRADTLKFRNWWLDRIVDEDLDIGTANKNLGILAKMYKDYNKVQQLNLPPVFSDLRIEGETDKQRAAFLAAFVQEKILGDGVLDALNAEARALLLLVADTGLRLSEASSLTAATIFLDAAVPHVQVRAIGRQLKVAHTARDIPLVGAALAAVKAFPTGFPRYLDKADSLSALVNKYLDNRGLLPTDNHSFYSLRHTFEDRLTAVDAPEKVIAALMGHKSLRPKYGSGPDLEQKQRWMQQIAFKPPVHG
ncbi:MAG: tyrosine-type recombinase/integrase [Cypionkella sp.]